jgi:hypothetical protein
MSTAIVTHFKSPHSQFISLLIDTGLQVLSELKSFAQNHQHAIFTGGSSLAFVIFQMCELGEITEPPQVTVSGCLSE